jgi:hypothetical protein
MPHYLFESRFTDEAIRTASSSPGTQRRTSLSIVESFGDQLMEEFTSWDMGASYVIADCPDDDAASVLARTLKKSCSFASIEITRLIDATLAMAVMRNADRHAAG